MERYAFNERLEGRPLSLLASEQRERNGPLDEYCVFICWVTPAYGLQANRWQVTVQIFTGLTTIHWIDGPFQFPQPT